MKKVFGFILLFLVISSIWIPRVQAADITLDDVYNKFKEMADEDGIFDEKDVEITHDENGIYITYDYKTDLEQYTLNTEFSYENGVISYIYSESKTDNLVFLRTFTDSSWITYLVYSVAELNGYNIEQLQNMGIEESDLTFEENGFEAKTFRYNITHETGYTAGEGYESLRIDINRFNLDSYINNDSSQNNKQDNDNSNQNNSNNVNNSSTNTKDNNDVDNPQTGYILPLIGFLGTFSIIILLLWINKEKKSIYKI